MVSSYIGVMQAPLNQAWIPEKKRKKQLYKNVNFIRAGLVFTCNLQSICLIKRTIEKLTKMYLITWLIKRRKLVRVSQYNALVCVIFLVHPLVLSVVEQVACLLDATSSIHFDTMAKIIGWEIENCLSVCVLWPEGQTHAQSHSITTHSCWKLWYVAFQYSRLFLFFSCMLHLNVAMFCLIWGSSYAFLFPILYYFFIQDIFLYFFILRI